jgi:hypothetical protein
VGILISIALIVYVSRIILKSKKYIHTNGEIIGWYVSTEYNVVNIEYYFIKIKFHDVEGVDHEFNSRVGYPWRAGTIGNCMPVLYDPSDPGSAIENTILARWGFSAGISILAILAIFSGIKIS